MAFTISNGYLQTFWFNQTLIFWFLTGSKFWWNTLLCKECRIHFFFFLVWMVTFQIRSFCLCVAVFAQNVICLLFLSKTGGCYLTQLKKSLFQNPVLENTISLTFYSLFSFRFFLPWAIEIEPPRSLDRNVASRDICDSPHASDILIDLWQIACLPSSWLEQWRKLRMKRKSGGKVGKWERRHDQLSVRVLLSLGPTIPTISHPLAQQVWCTAGHLQAYAILI